jgi:hypothetical protein
MFGQLAFSKALITPRTFIGFFGRATDYRRGAPTG